MNCSFVFPLLPILSHQFVILSFLSSWQPLAHRWWWQGHSNVQEQGGIGDQFRPSAETWPILAHHLRKARCRMMLSSFCWDISLIMFLYGCESKCKVWIMLRAHMCSRPTIQTPDPDPFRGNDPDVMIQTEMMNNSIDVRTPCGVVKKQFHVFSGTLSS